MAFAYLFYSVEDNILESFLDFLEASLISLNILLSILTISCLGKTYTADFFTNSLMLEPPYTKIISGFNGSN